MKIGFDAKRIFHNKTGLGNYGRDLVKILTTYNPENQYLLYNPKRKKVNRLALNNTNLIEKLPQSSFWRFFSSLWRQKPIVQDLLKDNITIYHGLSGEIPAGIEKTNIKTLVTVHDLIFMRYPKLYGFIDQRIHVKKVRNAVSNADKVIAISEQTKQDIVEFLSVPEDKIEVIYQGCHKTFKEEKTLEFRKQVLEKLQLPENFILNVGTINERKNLFSLVKAIKDIDVNLVVVGEKTSYFNQIETYIDQHNLVSKITIVSGLSLDDLSALYQQAELFIYPSIFEGFGIPIIEALYSKTPVITSKGSCFEEAGGLNSIYVESDNIISLAKKINLLLENEVLKKKIAESGFKYAQKFNDNVIAENYIKVYKSLNI